MGRGSDLCTLLTATTVELSKYALELLDTLVASTLSTNPEQSASAIAATQGDQPRFERLSLPDDYSVQR